MTIYIPTGKGQPRVPIESATERQLSSYISWQAKELRENPGSTFAAKNRQQLEAARRRLAELQSAPPAPAAPVLEFEVPKEFALREAISDAGRVNEFLSWLEQNCHLVSPSTRVDQIPEGFGIQVDLVRIDVAPEGFDLFELQGKVGLTAVALQRIRNATTLSWSPSESGILAKERDCVLYRAVGYYQTFDQQFRPATGHVELDARDGSPLIERIKASSKRKKDSDGGAREILELRTFLLRRAETMAKSRAIADMGVRRYYENRNELLKPFGVARLVFTGAYSDPATRRLANLRRMEHALEGVSALYGPRAASRGLTRAPELNPAPCAEEFEADILEAEVGASDIYEKF